MDSQLLNETDEVDRVNNTNSSRGFQCPDDIPTTALLFSAMPFQGYIVLGILFVFTVVTCVIYGEEVVFIMKVFKNSHRQKKTIWILAFYPVFSVCGFLAVLIPRSGCLIDMVANMFFGTCLYNFGRLMVHYLGGSTRMWKIIDPDRHYDMNTPPCCCCCPCLPHPKFTRAAYLRMKIQVLQVAIVRPIIMFLAAILWTNKSYHPGQLSPYNGFVYITIINVVSTCVAVYGLMLMRGAFRPELEQQFLITGKIAAIQLTLIVSAIPNLIIAILVTTNVIKCGEILHSKARGEEIYHALLVLLMLPFGMMGRYFFRRVSDGAGFAKDKIALINGGDTCQNEKCAALLDGVGDGRESKV